MPDEICMIEYDWKKKSITLFIRSTQIVGIQEVGEVNAFDLQTDDKRLLDFITEHGRYNPDR